MLQNIKKPLRATSISEGLNSVEVSSLSSRQLKSCSVDILSEILIWLNLVSQREERYIFSLFQVFSQMQIWQQSMCFIIVHFENIVPHSNPKMNGLRHRLPYDANKKKDIFEAECKTIGNLSEIAPICLFNVDLL